MKRRIKWILVIVLSLLWLAYGYNKHRSSKSPLEINKTDSPKTLDSSSIYLYGDSWVAHNSLDQDIKNALNTHGLHLRIKSYGYPGATSRQLYETLQGAGSLTSAAAILDTPPLYCVVIVGVNDAASQLGPEYYAHHTSLIVKTLLHHGITPVLLELPEFGLAETMAHSGLLIRSKNHLMALFNNKGETDNILTYRNTLHHKLKQENLLPHTILVPFQNISTDYNKDTHLFKDPSHLNKIGNALLAHEIVKHLLKRT